MTSGTEMNEEENFPKLERNVWKSRTSYALDFATKPSRNFIEDLRNKNKTLTDKIVATGLIGLTTPILIAFSPLIISLGYYASFIETKYSPEHRKYIEN